MGEAGNNTSNNYFQMTSSDLPLGIDFGHNHSLEVQEEQFVKIIKAALEFKVVLHIHARNDKGKLLLTVYCKQ